MAPLWPTAPKKHIWDGHPVRNWTRKTYFIPEEHRIYFSFYLLEMAGGWGGKNGHLEWRVLDNSYSRMVLLPAPEGISYLIKNCKIFISAKCSPSSAPLPIWERGGWSRAGMIVWILHKHWNYQQTGSLRPCYFFSRDVSIPITAAAAPKFQAKHKRKWEGVSLGWPQAPHPCSQGYHQSPALTPVMETSFKES